MVMNIINWPTSVVVKLNTIVKICKYKRFHKGHHFILMAMEVHDALGRNMDRFIKECDHFFHDRQLRGHLFFYFYI